MPSEGIRTEPCTTIRDPAASRNVSWRISFLKRHPFAIASTSFAILLVALLAYAEYGHGDRDFYPKALKCFLFPGFLPGYIVATITNCMLAGMVAFLFGMLIFYSVIGSVFDLLYFWVRRGQKRQPHR